jgi:hypothetical protein
MCQCKKQKKCKNDKKKHDKKNCKYNYKKFYDNKKCNCNNEQNIYFPLPNLPYQSINSIELNSWFMPGSIQTCCSNISSIRPIYKN